MRTPIKFKSKERIPLSDPKLNKTRIAPKNITTKPTKFLIESNETLSDFELYIRILKDKLYKFDLKLTKLDYFILAKLQDEKDFLKIVSLEDLNLTTCNNNLVKMRKLGLILGRRTGSTFILELRKDLNIVLPDLPDLPKSESSDIYIITKFKRGLNV